MPQNLSDLNNKQQPRKTELAIAQKDKVTLTKKQAEFNKLVKKLERSRTDFEQLTQSLDQSLAFYASRIHPQEQQLVSLRSICVKLLFPFYKSKKQISKNEKQTLAEMISSNLEEILALSQQEPDDELKTILEDIGGASFDELKQDSFEEMKGGMEEMFEEMGFDANLDHIHAGMSEEEIMMKLREVHEEFARHKEKSEEEKAGRKKTKKQQAREDRELEIAAARKKSISSIYKQLAKAFHPDLETDYALKLQKEELMKQLTVAYESNDLHTMLKLEIEWIQKEENNAARLTDDKLGIYNELLKEQIAGIAQQMQETLAHPRYSYLQRYTSDPQRLTIKVLEKANAGLRETITSLKATERSLRAHDAVQYVKQLLRSYSRQHRYDDDWENELLWELLQQRRR